MLFVEFSLVLMEGSQGVFLIQGQILITKTRAVVEPAEENLSFHTGASRAIVFHIPSAEFKSPTALF